MAVSFFGGVADYAVDIHAEAVGDFGDSFAYPAHTDDDDCFAEEFFREVIFIASDPLFLLDLNPVGFMDISDQHKHKGEDVLGDWDGVDA